MDCFSPVYWTVPYQCNFIRSRVALEKLCFITILYLLELWAPISYHGQASFNWGVEPKWKIQSCQHQTHAWNSLDQSLNWTRLSGRSNFLVLSLFYSSSLSLFEEFNVKLMEICSCSSRYAHKRKQYCQWKISLLWLVISVMEWLDR